MTTAVVLGIARAVGETAPLLFTAFGYDLMNAQPVRRARRRACRCSSTGTSRSPTPPPIDRGLRRRPRAACSSCSSLFVLARVVGRDRSASGRVTPQRPPPVADAIDALPSPDRIARQEGPRHDRHVRPTAGGIASRRSRHDRTETARQCRRATGSTPAAVDARSAARRPGAATLEAARRVRLVRRPPRARGRRPVHARRRGHRAHRPVGLRQVDVPPPAQPHARAGARRRARRRDPARRRGHLRPRHPGPAGAHADRHGVPEAEPVPGHEHPRQRAGRAQAGPHQVRRQGRPRRAVARPGRPVAARCATGSTRPAAPCPAASSSGSASPGRWPCSPTCC